MSYYWPRTKEESYFDYPDGENTARKLWIALKGTGLVSICVATADVFLYTHPKGYLATLGRYGRICFPMLGITTAFVLFTNGATNIRQKDDHINWLIGGSAAGVVCGACCRSGAIGFISTVGFAAMAFIKKDALIHNFTMFAVDNKVQEGGIRGVRQDWTLTKHRPGNWTTGK